MTTRAEEMVFNPLGIQAPGLDWEERLIALQDFIPSERPVQLQVTVRDLFLIRSGLESLLRIYTRHEHLNREISEILQRLPEVEFEYEMAA